MKQPEEQAELADFSAQLLVAARQAGADAADVIIVQNRSLSVSCRLGSVEETEQAESQDFGLRVFIGRRQAIVSGDRFSAAAPGTLAERATAMARAMPEDPYCGLAAAEALATDWQVPDVCDSADVSADRLTDLALACEQAGLDIQGITNSGGAGAGYSRSGVFLATSTGFHGYYARTGYSLSATMLAGEGTAMERDYDFESRTHFADLPAPETIGVKAAERTLRRLGATKPKSVQGSVIFDQRVSSSLVGHLLGAISGAAIARKTSFLKDAMGTAILPGKVAIIDDPGRDRGLRSKPFDAEGLGAARLNLVEDGTLNHWLLDSASARELGLESNGRAARSVGGPPSPASTNTHMEAGTDDPDSLIAGVEQGLLVTDLIGHGVNLVTGDYSRGAAGLWIEKGEITGPVSEVTIAGNLRDMFARLVPASDLSMNRAVNAPTLLIDGMTIAGR